MKYYRVAADCEPRLLVETDDGTFDLTSAHEGLRSLADVYETADRAGLAAADLVADRLSGAEPVDPDPESFEAPVRPPEVWAAGVTYEISEEAREAESEDPDVYTKVYRSDRPEVFLKATPSRTVGPGGAIGIRGDSEWDVPEPELGLVLYRGEIVGYTVGNDVSSRSIEGANPLYLPQAKVYDRCCALGPCVVAVDAVEDPLDLEMSMSIRRGGEVVFEGGTETSEMVRTPEELAEYLTRHNALPELAVLLTGTALVPEEGFTLRPDDEVEIAIEGIGTLTNPVTTV